MKKYIPTKEKIDIILKMYNEQLLGSKTISEKVGLHKQIVLTGGFDITKLVIEDLNK